MTVQLDHFVVPSRNRFASAKLLADLLGVRFAVPDEGPFAPVYVNDGLTLDFIDIDADAPLHRHHYCFRVTQVEFDSILGRINAAGIKYGSGVDEPTDMQINTRLGGRCIYWNEPDGHLWEMLTISYKRPAD